MSPVGRSAPARTPADRHAAGDERLTHMANYNLYNALDLNEDWSCDELRDHLDG
ncbi:hypothetical protein [Corynebacterium bovis]|uniref:hypothetical protein n=1 Tax=Corynebacterium bovis TaxID=36808 RepID=UPI0031399013